VVATDRRGRAPRRVVRRQEGVDGAVYVLDGARVREVHGNGPARQQRQPRDPPGAVVHVERVDAGQPRRLNP
jgi:hypothetical protein